MPAPEDVNVFAKVRAELQRAQAKHKTPMRSSHEGYAILKEEVDEMWDAIKANDVNHARREAVQVAAMAIRFLLDIPAKIEDAPPIPRAPAEAHERAPRLDDFLPEEVAQAQG